MNKFLYLFFLVFSGIVIMPIFSYADYIPPEAHIYKTGEVHLIGARLEKRHALNLFTVNVWGYQWKVFADYDAKFQSADGMLLDPQQILVDHLLEVKGLPSKKEIGLIEAQIIRDFSVPGSGAALPVVSLSPAVLPPVLAPLPVAVRPDLATSSPGVPAVAGVSKRILTMNLYLGMRGDEVKILQEFLQKGGWGIPDDGPVTGYFGKITEAAVKKFQISRGLETVGFVGVKTRAFINELLHE
ncbi:MAG: peptidoglycan-binding protein [Candidatus Sungbacteria bacterium]|nr:peptidoglycan-binding protein [Candidatus Sungbacteria bacterium]